MPTHPAAAIVNATLDDADYVTELIGAAYGPQAFARWLVPDQEQRAKVLPAYVRIQVEKLLRDTHAGMVQMTADQSAVAVWAFHDLGDPAVPFLGYEQQVAEACGEAKMAILQRDLTPRFLHFDKLLDRHRPVGPHHRLAFLAVAATEQRRGLGSALLAHHHALLEQRHLPAFLFANSEGSRRLFERLGYQVMGGAFYLPGRIRVWPMWRHPAGANGSHVLH